MKLAIDTALAKRIGLLAGPVILAMVSQTLINQVDHALIGRLPQVDSIPGQAALFPSLVLMWLVGGSLSAISVGTQALTARRTGEEADHRAGSVMLNSVSVAILLSSVLAALFWYLTPHLFPYLAKDADVIRLGVPYTRWRMVGVLPMVGAISYKSWFDGLGHTRVHMGAAITMNLLNFVLNVALVFGKWGFPAMGVEGSAIASMLSSYLGFFIMIAWSLRSEYRLRFANYKFSNLSGGQMWEIFKLSYPSAIATMCVMTGFGLFQLIVGRLDTAAGHGPIYGAATWNVIIVLMLFFTAFMAYGSATATLVGQSLGAKRTDLAEAYGWEAVKIGVYFTIVIGVLIAIFPGAILHVLSKDDAVIAAATPVLRVCGGLLPFVLSGLVLTQALFGAGNTTFVMAVEFGLHFFCLVPLAWFCGVTMGWGMMGVWMGAFVYILLLATIMGWKFAEGRWKEIRI